MHYAADGLLEQGVLAELKGHPDPTKFRDALGKFEKAAKIMAELEQQMTALEKVHEGSKLDPAFEKALSKILAEHPGLERVTRHQRRYSNIAGKGAPGAGNKPTAFGDDLGAIMRAHREDLSVLRKQLDETITDFRSVMAVAEKGEFSALMLSGRAGFADKIQESVDLTETFAHFYTRSCMTTIAATMHAYPSSLRWLPGAGENRWSGDPSTPSTPTQDDTPPAPVGTEEEATEGSGGPEPLPPKSGRCSVSTESGTDVWLLSLFGLALFRRRGRASEGW